MLCWGKTPLCLGTSRPNGGCEQGDTSQGIFPCRYLVKTTTTTNTTETNSVPACRSTTQSSAGFSLQQRVGLSGGCVCKRRAPRAGYKPPGRALPKPQHVPGGDELGCSFCVTLPRAARLAWVKSLAHVSSAGCLQRLAPRGAGLGCAPLSASGTWGERGPLGDAVAER